MLAGGSTREEILSDYPYLEDEDMTTALEFAARYGSSRLHGRRFVKFLVDANLPPALVRWLER